MAGGALLAAAGAGLSLAGIMALKRRTAEAWFAEHGRLPCPSPKPGDPPLDARVCIYQRGVEGEAAFAGVCNDLYRMHCYEKHGVRTRDELTRVLRQYPRYSRLVMAAHGDPSWFFAGFGGINAAYFARNLEGRIAPNAILSLAGCRAGANPGEPERWTGDVGDGGEDGISGLLRDALVLAGAPTSAEIRAHTTTGHTTENPRARKFRFAHAGQPGTAVPLQQGEQAERWILGMAGFERWSGTFSYNTTNIVGGALLLAGIGVGAAGIYKLVKD